MKISMIIVRTLMGFMFLFSSIVVLFNLIPQPEMKGSVKVFMNGIKASVYLLPLIKVTELLCGLAFISGRFVTLAAVLIFLIIINILLYYLFIGPEGLPVAILLFAGNLFLAYYYSNNYRSLFNTK